MSTANLLHQYTVSKLNLQTFSSWIVSTFPTARPPTTEQITPHTFTSRVCRRYGILKRWQQPFRYALCAFPLHHREGQVREMVPAKFLPPIFTMNLSGNMPLFPYLESYHPGNLYSIQITLNLRNTTSCCNWLEKDQSIKTLKYDAFHMTRMIGYHMMLHEKQTCEQHAQLSRSGWCRTRRIKQTHNKLPSRNREVEFTVTMSNN